MTPDPRPKRQEAKIVQGPQVVPVSQLDEHGVAPQVRVPAPDPKTIYTGFVHSRKVTPKTDD